MNILKSTIGYLAETLNVLVSTDAPENRPSAFVTVNRSNGAVTRVDDRATLTVQAWCKDRLQAETFADDVVNALLVMPDAIDGVFSVETQKAWFPEQGTQTFPRYVITCAVYCRK